MILKRLFVLCLMTTGLVISSKAQSYVLQDSDLTVDANGIITNCSYDFSNKNITIPNSVGGKAITGIADVNVFGSIKIFYSKGITNVVLPDGIKTIGENAFKGNDLTTVTLPNGLEKISESAFSGNDFAFKEIDIPNSVTYIGQYAFSMNGVDSIVLPTVTKTGFVGWINQDGVEYAGGTKVKYTGSEYRAVIKYTLKDEDVEVNADGLITSCSYDFEYTDIIIPGTLDGVVVKGIESKSWTGVFDSKGITSLELPNSLTHIGNYAFPDNELEEINIPAGVKYVGTQAFSSNNLASVDIPNSVIYIGQQAFWGIDSIVLPSPTEPGFEYWISSSGETFLGGTKIKPAYDYFEAKIVYTLQDADVRMIDGVIDSCLYDFSSKYIKIPDSLNNQRITGIANGSEPSFYNYLGVFSKKGIKEIQLPKFLISIGDYAFYDNELDSLIVLPDSVKQIGLDAFTLNSSFKGIVLPSPKQGNLICENWKDSYNNIYEVGDTVKNFYEISYSAQFTNPPGTSIISLSGSLDYEDVEINSTKNKVLTISNTGNSTINVSDIVLPEGYTADWESGEIKAEESQEVNITFSPTDIKSYAGTITVESDATLGENTIAISGTGIKDGTGLNNISKSKSLLVCPNPATTHLTIAAELQNALVAIFDLNGKLLFSQEMIDNKINISNLEKGIYVLKIANNKTNLQARFIKE